MTEVRFSGLITMDFLVLQVSKGEARDLLEVFRDRGCWLAFGDWVLMRISGILGAGRWDGGLKAEKGLRTGVCGLLRTFLRSLLPLEGVIWVWGCILDCEVVIWTD